MKESNPTSATPELELEPMRDCSEGLSPLNAKTFTIVILVLTLFLVLGEAWRRKMIEAAERKEAVEHCRGIFVSLHLWSADNSGCYPYWALDEPNRLISSRGLKGPKFASHAPLSSNEAFRELFKGGVYSRSNDELTFGCPRSPFHPDGNVGTAPSFKEALLKGENHWAMSNDLTDSSPRDFALIFENPADASMPPRWNTDVAGQAKPGRCWPDRTVVMGFNDGTVRWVPLEAGPGLRKLKEDVFSSVSSSSVVTGILQVDP